MRRNFFPRNGFKGLRRIGITIAIASLVFQPSVFPIQDRSSAALAEVIDSSIQRRLQHLLEQAVSRSEPKLGGGLLAISTLKTEHGQPMMALVVGPHSETNDVPVTRDTPYGLASITKVMVASLTFIYSERGLLDIDTPILDLTANDGWLLQHVSNPEFRDNLKALTLRDLLAHRSGLPDYWENDSFFSTWMEAKDKKWSPSELIDWAGREDPVCAPRSCFQYSDTNYVIIGLALEQLTGRKLHDQLRTEIFVPLQMRCSWMFFEEPVPKGCDAPTHSYEEDLDVTDNRMQSADWSGGGVYSTLEDQLKLLRGLFGGGLISRDSLDNMQYWDKSDSDEDIEYGLGLFKTSAGPDITLVGHTGIHNSFSFLWVEAGILIVGSLNQSHNEALKELVFPAIRGLQEDGVYVNYKR